LPGFGCGGTADCNEAGTSFGAFFFFAAVPPGLLFDFFKLEPYQIKLDTLQKVIMAKIRFHDIMFADGFRAGQFRTYTKLSQKHK
jgi:hypothetical protein